MRTLLDVAAVLDEWMVEEILDDSLYRGAAKLSVCRWVANNLTGRGRPGSSTFKKLLAERPPGFKPLESTLERDFRRLLKQSRLRLPDEQKEIRDERGFLARVDFVYASERVVIELDSYRYHTGRHAWQADLERQNRLIREGWRVLRFTWWDIRERAEYVLDEIARTLNYGGTSFGTVDI